LLSLLGCQQTCTISEKLCQACTCTMLLIMQGLIIKHPEFVTQRLKQNAVNFVSNISAASKQYVSFV